MANPGTFAVNKQTNNKIMGRICLYSHSAYGCAYMLGNICFLLNWNGGDLEMKNTCLLVISQSTFIFSDNKYRVILRQLKSMV